MKKKFRNITIDGDDSWAWMYKLSGTEGYPNLKIWKDRKIVFKKFYWGRQRYTITPGLISRFIKIYLK